MHLKEWRKKYNHTMKYCYQYLGITYVTYTRYESGARQSLRASTIHAIIKMTNGEVDANDLYGYTPERLAEIRAKNAKKAPK